MSEERIIVDDKIICKGCLLTSRYDGLDSSTGFSNIAWTCKLFCEGLSYAVTESGVHQQWRCDKCKQAFPNGMKIVDKEA